MRVGPPEFQSTDAMSDKSKLARNNLLRAAVCLAYLQAWKLGPSEGGGPFYHFFPFNNYLADVNGAGHGQLNYDWARAMLIEQMGFHYADDLIPAAPPENLAVSDHLANLVYHYKPRLTERDKAERHPEGPLTLFHELIESLLMEDVKAAIRKYGFPITHPGFTDRGQIYNVWMAQLGRWQAGVLAINQPIKT